MTATQRSVLKRPWGTMAVHAWGSDAPAYLFLHGNGCAAADWEALRPFLPEDTPAISADFAGHGASDAPGMSVAISDLVEDILALIEVRQLSNLVLVGHSLGGMVGLEVAYRSRAIAALVLAEGWTSSAAWGAFGQGHHFGGLPETAIAEIRAATRNLQERLGTRHDHYWQTVCAFDGYAMLEQLTIPIMEIYGTAGRREDSTERLRIPDTPFVQLRWIDGAGHFLLRERPAEIARIYQEARERATEIRNLSCPQL